MKKVLILVAVIIVCVAVLVGGAIFAISKLSSSINEDFNTSIVLFNLFCSNLNNGNNTDAYTLTAKEYQKIYTQDQFNSIVVPTLKNCKTFELASPLVAKEKVLTGSLKQSYFVGNIKFNDSTPDKFIAITFIYEDSKWRFAGFEKDTTLNNI